MRRLSLTGGELSPTGGELSLTSTEQQAGGRRSGAQLMAGGLPWPLTAARIAVIWLLDAEPAQV